MDKPRDTDENIGHKTHSEDNNKKKQKNQSEQTNKQKTTHTRKNITQHEKDAQQGSTKKTRIKERNLQWFYNMHRAHAPDYEYNFADYHVM
jgi:hypothetical protein